jgi:hypothetical protein
LAGRTPNEAVDAFLARLQRTLSCVVRGVAVASGSAPGVHHSITLYLEGRRGGDPARLSTHGRNGEIFFQVVLLFEVVAAPDASPRERYSVRTTFYHFDILDRDGNEVVVSHWEPEGISPVRTPHLHVPAAAPIQLPQRPGSAVASRRTYLNRLHLATGPVTIEDVVEVLIREFDVDPLRSDWETVLAANRVQPDR